MTTLCDGGHRPADRKLKGHGGSKKMGTKQTLARNLRQGEKEDAKKPNRSIAGMGCERNLPRADRGESWGNSMENREKNRGTTEGKNGFYSNTPRGERHDEG